MTDSPGQGEWHGWQIRGENGVITSIGAASQRGPIDIDANRANSYLISAAPEMYEFLTTLGEGLDKNGMTWQRLEPILRKIEGKR